MPGGRATYGQDTNAPSTCAIGELFFDTDAAAGENWLGCTAANTWTLLGAYGEGTAPPLRDHLKNTKHVFTVSHALAYAVVVDTS